MVGSDQGRETEPNNTAATADALTGSAGRIRGSLFTGVAGSQGSDTDFYSFTAPPGSKIYAAVINIQTAGSSDSVLAVLDVDGVTVLELDDQDGSLGGSSSSIAGTLLATGGTYYLRVTNFSLTSPMTNYNLYFTVQDPANLVAETEPNPNGAPQVMPASGYVSGVSDPAAETDTFSFSATAGDTIYLSADLDPERDVTTFNGRIGLGLFGTPANFLVVNDAGTFDTIDSEAIVMTVKTTGMYQVFLDATAGAGPTATYNFSAVVIPPAATGTITTYTNAVPVAIPDLGLASSTITIPDSKIIRNLKVVIDATHTFFTDLDVHLRSPNDNDNGLFTDVGTSTQTGAQNVSMDNNDALPIVFTVLNGANWQGEASYRLHWFKGENTLGTWTLDIRDDLGADVGTLNSWSLIVEEEPDPSAQPLVYSEDFEGTDGGYTHAGAADEWEWGTPATAATTSIAPFLTAASGVNCWKTDLDNTYDASSNQVLTSPAIDLSVGGGTGPLTLYWQQRYQTESNSFDRIWVRVTDVGDPSHTLVVWHSDNSTMTDSVGSPSVSLPASAGWGRYNADITDFAGDTIQVSFTLESDSSVNYGGWAVDDVQIRTNDLCPDDPDKTDPGVCGCGVPDTSKDGDTIVDCIDNCPFVANEDQADCDGDNIGDACEGEPDCNANGIPDSCDIAGGGSQDVNGNGIPDECEPGLIVPFCVGSAGCPCANDNDGSNDPAGCANFTSPGGSRLDGTGSASLGGDTLLLDTTGSYNGFLSVFIQGDSDVSPAPFGAGLRCVGGNLRKLFIVKTQVGDGADAPSAISIPAAPATVSGQSAAGGDPLSSGDSRSYQVYYRDPQMAGPCGNATATFNITNAIYVVWGP